MNTVGIDVPSRKSTAAALRSLGEVCSAAVGCCPQRGRIGFSHRALEGT